MAGLSALLELLELRNGVLYWRHREPGSLPRHYAKTCNLFNSKYAGQPVHGDTFKCCGIEYDTAETIALLRGAENARIRRRRPTKN